MIMKPSIFAATRIVNDYATAEKLISLHRSGPYMVEHPSLALLTWEDERTDVHGTSAAGICPDGYYFRCACGFETTPTRSMLNASAEIISHAMNTCAKCHGDKPTHGMDGGLDVFPRCSVCAF